MHVGRALGATRNVASRARSTGGRAMEGAAGRTSRGLNVAGDYTSSFAAANGRGILGRAASGASRVANFGSRHPKSMLGAAGAAIGYGGYRGFNNSRSARSSGGTRF